MAEDVEILDEAQIELMSGWWKRSSPQRSRKSALPNHYHKQNHLVPINPRCSARDLAVVFWFSVKMGRRGMVWYGGGMNEREREKKLETPKKSYWSRIIQPVKRLSKIFCCKYACLWTQPTSKCGSRWCNLSSASARLASRNIWRRIWWNQIRILRLMFVIFCQSTLMLYVEILIRQHVLLCVVA